MANVEVKCAECGHAQQVDKKQLGMSIKCPKCKDSFIAEAGDTYALARDPRPRPSAPLPTPPPSPSSSKTSGGRKPVDGPGPDADRRMADQFEKWAMDQDE